MPQRAHHPVRGWILAVAIAGLLGWSSQSSAVGFQRFDLSSAGLGVGNALAADAEHLSSMAYNPSALAFREGLDFEGTLGRRWGGLDAPGASSSPGSFFVNDFYAAYRGRARSWGLGLAVNRPFRMDSDFDQEFSTEGAPTRTTLDLVNINPLAAYKLRPGLAVSAGPNYYRTLDFEYSSLQRQNGSLGELKRSGDGDALGGTAGIMFWRESWSVAATYTTGADLEVNGQNLSNNDLHLPARARIGWKWRPNLWWSVHAGAVYTRWSQYDGLEGVDPGKDWKDTYGARLGAIARLSDLVKVRFGYSFDQGPKDSRTFDPRSDTGDRHSIHLGGTWDTDPLRLSFGYAFSVTGSKDVSGARISEFDGEHETSGHRLLMTIGYSPW